MYSIIHERVDPVAPPGKANGCLANVAVLYAVYVAGGAASALFSLLLPMPTYSNLWQRSVVDRLAEDPGFGVVDIIALLGAYLVWRRITRHPESRLARGGPYAWTVPAALLALSFLTTGLPGPPDWRDNLSQFFGTNCGNSDCLYEGFCTGPFYASVVYSLTLALLQRRTRHSGET